jgi:FlaA1/EpsC-like NDP-sugar epimerase
MLLDDKAILVTGGTGSLGSVFVHRVLSGAAGTPRKVIVLSRDEAKQHDMRLAYTHKRFTTDEVIYANFEQVLEFRIGDVRDYADVCSAVRDVDIVVNAAALKQVPTCEYFPEQALMTNALGATNIVRAIAEHGYPVETVVGISTDKACKPVNVMGMTKAIQERIFVAANVLAKGRTRYTAVRYGNVLASRGSVIPLFLEQVRNGGPVTVTAAEMTRFMTTLDQAVETVLLAIQDGQPGEILVPICPSSAIIDVARALIGERDIPIVFTGVRPGEKVHEVLISLEEGLHTHRIGDHYVIAPMLPELVSGQRADLPTLDREFDSTANVLSPQATVDLLREHHLLLDAGAPVSSGESRA